MMYIRGKIPITIQPLFWVFAIFISTMFSINNIVYIPIWLLIIFISLLVHEYGHALTARLCGKQPEIILVGMGGITRYDPTGLSLLQQFFIVLNGPLAGLLLAAAAFFTAKLSLLQNTLLYSILIEITRLNIVWTMINLMPILPLDGGHLLRIIAAAVFGSRSIGLVVIIGMISAFLLTGMAFLYQQVFIGAIFLLFAFENYKFWIDGDSLVEHDPNYSLKNQLTEAQEAISEGRVEEAKRRLEEICAAAKKGTVFQTATQQLAFLYYNQGNTERTYELLTSIAKFTANEALLLLHELAFSHKNHALVADISAKCYKIYPLQEVALRNARSFGYLNNSKYAAGWLQTATRLAPLDVVKVLQEEAFSTVKNTSVFGQFLK